MRFTLPVQHANEVAILKAHGADELYCGYLDDSWRKMYGGDATISRRQGEANLFTPEALEALLAEARRCEIPVHLTLNARYTGEQLPYLLSLAERWTALGGNGIILQDPVLLRLLRPAVPLVLTVSLLAVTVNRDGAAFWQDLGADRIVFPRFLSFQDMTAICTAVPELTYEAMVMGDHCPFVDGFCRSVHAESFQSAEPDAPVTTMLETFNPSGRACHLCHQYELPEADPCAACSLSALASCGIGIGKLGGRGLPLETRLRWLSFLHMARHTAQPDALPSRYREAFGHDCHCYYPREEARP